MGVSGSSFAGIGVSPLTVAATGGLLLWWGPATPPWQIAATLVEVGPWASQHTQFAIASLRGVKLPDFSALAHKVAEILSED